MLKVVPFDGQTVKGDSMSECNWLVVLMKIETNIVEYIDAYLLLHLVVFVACLCTYGHVHPLLLVFTVVLWTCAFLALFANRRWPVIKSMALTIVNADSDVASRV